MKILKVKLEYWLPAKNIGASGATPAKPTYTCDIISHVTIIFQAAS